MGLVVRIQSPKNMKAAGWRPSRKGIYITRNLGLREEKGHSPGAVEGAGPPPPPGACSLASLSPLGPALLASALSMLQALEDLP